MWYTHYSQSVNQPASQSVSHSVMKTASIHPSIKHPPLESAHSQPLSLNISTPPSKISTPPTPFAHSFTTFYLSIYRSIIHSPDPTHIVHPHSPPTSQPASEPIRHENRISIYIDTYIHTYIHSSIEHPSLEPAHIFTEFLSISTSSFHLQNIFTSS